MEFFRFKINENHYNFKASIDKMIFAINAEGRGCFNIDYLLEKQDDALVCKLLIKDESKLKDALTKFPIYVNKLKGVSSPLMFDLMCGYKSIKGSYPTAMNIWLCGYVSASDVDSLSLINAQNLLNDNAKQYFIYCDKQPTTFLINDDKCIINNQQYYPITFYQCPKTPKGRLLNNVNYTKELKAAFTCFNKSAYDVFVSKNLNSVLKTDFCGNKALLNTNNKRYEDLKTCDANDNEDMESLTNKMLGLVKKQN